MRVILERNFIFATVPRVLNCVDGVRNIFTCNEWMKN
jgi:hypothetical protein